MKGWRVLKTKSHRTRPLGELTWFTVGELRLTVTELEVAYTRAGLDPHTVPLIQPRHAFQRATQRLRQAIPLEDGNTLNVHVRPIVEQDGQVMRMVVEELVDASEQTLHHANVAKLIWEHDDRDTATVISSPEETDPHPKVASALAALQDLFDEARETFIGRTIRQLVGDLLAQGDPISVRRAGGVFFVSWARRPIVRQLTGLVEAIRDLSGHDGTEAYAVPVVNSGQQRLMVRRAAVQDLGEQIIGLQTTCTELLENPSGGVIQRSADVVVRDLARLRGVVARYQTVTNDQLAVLTARLDGVAVLATQILGRVDPGQ